MKGLMKTTGATVTIISLFAITFLLAGCSGGGGGEAPASPAFQVSGVAAAGAPIIGNVFLKDKNNKQSRTSTDQLGNFSFSLDESYKPPFILKAEGAYAGKNYTLYSASTGFGRANVNPFTHLALASVIGQSPETFYNNTVMDLGMITDAALKTATENIKTMMQPLLTAKNITTFDPLSGAYRADGTGLDRIFDVVKVEVNPDRSVNIVNKVANTPIASGTISSIPSPISEDVIAQLSQAMFDLDAVDKKLIGIWQRTDSGETTQGKEYLTSHQGYLGNFSSGSFKRAAPFTWTVENNTVIEFTTAGYNGLPAETRRETIQALTETTLQQLREEDAKTRNWQRAGSESDAIPVAPSPLEGMEWVLTSLNGKSVIEGKSTIKFSNGTAGGKAGCNWFDGRYTAMGAGALSITELVQTMSFCQISVTPPPVEGVTTPPVNFKPSAIMDQEGDFMTALGKAVVYRIIDNRLEMDNAAGVTTLAFVLKN